MKRNIIVIWSRNVLLLLILTLTVSTLWAEQADNFLPPVTPPINFTEPSIQKLFSPNWIKKVSGHYSRPDWRRMIDSVWGPGLPVGEKLAIFDLFWQTIDYNFACFNNLTVNWDSLRIVYRAEIEDTVSQGRFAAIMNHLAKSLMEGHTIITDNLVNTATNLLPGVPVWVIGGWEDVGHFGAALTPLPDSSLLVYRVVNNHPLGLERGDIVLGYDRRPWTAILRELQEAQLPIRFCGGNGSANSSVKHSLLIGAGMNWHLFDTIDIVKYSTGDTMHLPTSLLVGHNMQINATEQMDIPGVPMPVGAASYGIVSGTQIGYIYDWAWTGNAKAEFYNAVNTLVSDTTLKGIIIDFRYNGGGNMFLADSGLHLLFRDTVETICFSVRSDPNNHFLMRVVTPAYGYLIHGNGIGYNKPIAVLVGPGAMSAGDQVAFRMTFHPRVKTFGRSTNTAFSGLTVLNVHAGWTAWYAQAEACLASDTTYFLTHREFPVDVPVWHTRDAVAQGEDAVVNAAMAWIDSASGINEREMTSYDLLTQSSLNCTKPNPITNGVAHISFTIATQTNAAIKIYDALGRIVKTIENRNFEKGVYNYIWNSTDDNNCRVAEGIYFCTLETARQNFTKKLVLMK